MSALPMISRTTLTHLQQQAEDGQMGTVEILDALAVELDEAGFPDLADTLRSGATMVKRHLDDHVRQT